MNDWQQRVVDERDALGVKLTALRAFISGNPAFKSLDKIDQGLMRDQADAMQDYWHCLDDRIERFGKGKS